MLQMLTLNSETFDIDELLEDIEKAAWGYFEDTNNYPDTLYVSSFIYNTLYDYTRRHTHARQAYGPPGYNKLMFATSAGQITTVEIAGRDDNFWAVCKHGDIETGLIEKMILGDKDVDATN